MTKPIQSNYVKASNLIFVASAIGVIIIIVSKNEYGSSNQIIGAAATVLFWIGLGYLVRRGLTWTKYILLFMAFAGIIMGIPIIVTELFERNPVAGLINIIQILVQVWATILVFIRPTSQ